MPRVCECMMNETCQAEPGSQECFDTFLKGVEEIGEAEGMCAVEIPNCLREAFEQVIEQASASGE